jgi:hypothetical protein
MFTEEIKNIVSIKDCEYPFVSLYLDISPDRHGRANYEIFLKKRHKEIEDSLGDNKEHLENFKSIATKINKYLTNLIVDGTQGVAIFATAKPEYFIPIEVPKPFSNELKLGYVASLSQLVNISEMAEKIATVVGDTKRTYIYISSLGNKISEEFIEGGVDFEQKTKQWASKVYIRSGKSFGYSSDTTKKDRFEQKIINFYVDDIVNQLQKMKQDDDFKYLVLYGVKEFTELVKDNLHDELKEILIDVSSLDLKKKTDQELIKFSESIYNEFLEEQQITQQKHLKEEILADGLAVAGKEPTIVALSNGKVDTLIIGKNLKEVGYVCINCTFITSAGKPEFCPICNSEVVETDLKEIMINLAKQFNCDVEIVDEIPEFKKLGGVGAILRFK